MYSAVGKLELRLRLWEGVKRNPHCSRAIRGDFNPEQKLQVSKYQKSETKHRRLYLRHIWQMESYDLAFYLN